MAGSRSTWCREKTIDLALYGAFVLAPLTVIAVIGEVENLLGFIIIGIIIMMMLVVSIYKSKNRGGPEVDWYYGNKPGVPSDGTDTEEADT